MTQNSRVYIWTSVGSCGERAYVNVLPDTTETGRYRTGDHAIVHFHMESLRHVELTDEALGWSILFGLHLHKVGGAYTLLLDATAGLGGTLTFDSLTLSLDPSMPPGSKYEKTL
jgi:hypothetical protein